MGRFCVFPVVRQAVEVIATTLRPGLLPHMRVPPTCVSTLLCLARVPAPPPRATQAVSTRGVGREAGEQRVVRRADVAPRLLFGVGQVEVVRIVVVTRPLLAAPNAQGGRGKAARASRVLPCTVVPRADGDQTVSVGVPLGGSAPLNGERRVRYRPSAAVNRSA